MATKGKSKGLLKGLRYISQIFDEDKEPEMQIGNPTDVKHVAHIGCDGPAVEAPSWMKDFNSKPGFSAPLGPPTESKENPEIKWVSEDSKRGPNKGAASSPDVPKSSRRNLDNNSSSSSPRRHKPKNTRRQPAKDSPDNSSQESGNSIPSIPRKSRRKKSSGSSEGGSTRSKTKSVDAENENTDPGRGPDARTNPTSRRPRSRLGEGGNGNKVTFKD